MVVALRQRLDCARQRQRARLKSRQVASVQGETTCTRMRLTLRIRDRLLPNLHHWKSILPISSTNQVVVLFLPGELVSFLRKKPPNQLTPDTEKSVVGRFASGVLRFAFCVLGLCFEGLRSNGHVRKYLCFERESPGSERNPYVPCRTPEFSAKTL